MLQAILDLSKQLISIPSTKENPKELKKVLEIAKKELKDFTIEEFEKDGISSILAYNSKTRPKKFKVVLNAHLDVVPGKENQYTPVKKDGKLLGRGAYDMKAAAVVELLVFKELAGKVNYPLALQLVTDEEVGGFKGTKHQLEKDVRADFVIAGENTDLTIINRAKGIIWVKITTQGTSAHGAYPWLGDNAVVRMSDVINQILRKYPAPLKEVWKTTVTVSSLNTENKTYNKIPDLCDCMLDIRYIPEDKDVIIPFLKKFENEKVSVDIIENEPIHFTDANNQYLKILGQSINSVLSKKAQILAHHGGSDIRHYNQVKCSGVEFGPKGAGHHTDNEWVDIQSLEEYYKILKDFLLRF